MTHLQKDKDEEEDERGVEGKDANAPCQGKVFEPGKVEADLPHNLSNGACAEPGITWHSDRPEAAPQNKRMSVTQSVSVMFSHVSMVVPRALTLSQ